jgi:hypothetical protein
MIIANMWNVSQAKQRPIGYARRVRKVIIDRLHGALAAVTRVLLCHWLTCYHSWRWGEFHFYRHFVMVYYSVDSGYERAPVFDREVVTRRPRFPPVSPLVVMKGVAPVL